MEDKVILPGESLQEGDVLQTRLGEQIEILDKIGSGGQGYVYRIRYRGEYKALKWYKSLPDPEAFYENLLNNIKKGPPDDNFLWMQDLTEWKNGTFGYIMDLVPGDYYEISQFLINNVRFPSWKRAVDAALYIVKGFRMLHNRGQSYQDLNDGNFFINPMTGKALIADNDNVAPNGENLGIVGMPRFIAPEVVRGENLPDTASDRYSLSAILFMLFCYGHPLEGRAGTPFVLTPKQNMEIYGTHPVFMFDPEDESNRPIPGIQDHVSELWNCLPEYIRSIFVRAFGRESLMKKKRVTEYDWMKALVRFRSDIVKCSCGNEIFIQNGQNTPCDRCGKMSDIRDRIVFDEYAIPAVAGTRIYRLQLGAANFEDALKPVASILANPDNPTDIRIKNLMGESWICKTPSGNVKRLESARMAPVKKGICFKVQDTEFYVQ